MLIASLVQHEEELEQIHQLNLQNLKTNLSAAQQAGQGFVTWEYPLSLLKAMHELAPSVIIKHNEKVVAYALTTLRQASTFHEDLRIMFKNLEPIMYRNKPLADHNFYCMGQICVAGPYRGRGLVNMLYQKHREIFKDRFDFLLTEISTSNTRSLRAHQNTGFQTIHTYKDPVDEWNVVIWEW